MPVAVKTGKIYVIYSKWQSFDVYICAVLAAHRFRLKAAQLPESKQQHLTAAPAPWPQQHSARQTGPRVPLQELW
jgi:hypothetical protein